MHFLAFMWYVEKQRSLEVVRDGHFVTTFMVPGMREGKVGCFVSVSTSRSTRVLNRQMALFQLNVVPTAAFWLYFDIWFYEGVREGMESVGVCDSREDVYPVSCLKAFDKHACTTGLVMFNYMGINDGAHHGHWIGTVRDVRASLGGGGGKEGMLGLESRTHP